MVWGVFSIYYIFFIYYYIFLCVLFRFRVNGVVLGVYYIHLLFQLFFPDSLSLLRKIIIVDNIDTGF